MYVVYEHAKIYVGPFIAYMRRRACDELELFKWFGESDGARLRIDL